MITTVMNNPNPQTRTPKKLYFNDLYHDHEKTPCKTKNIGLLQQMFHKCLRFVPLVCVYNGINSTIYTGIWLLIHSLRSCLSYACWQLFVIIFSFLIHVIRFDFFNSKTCTQFFYMKTSHSLWLLLTVLVQAHPVVQFWPL